MELDGQIQIIFTGQAKDEILIDQQTILFNRRHLVFDSRAIETLLVIPI
jgi:anthranilate 1,2-dioxygenase small subunit